MSEKNSSFTDSDLQALGRGLAKILRSRPEFDPRTQAIHERLADWAEQSYYSKNRIGGYNPIFYGKAFD